MYLNEDDFRQYKRGDLLYISLDDAPEEDMTFLLVEFLKLYHHSSAHAWYIQLYIIDSSSRWKVAVEGQIHYAVRKITKIKEATKAEFILYHLEEEGDGNVLTGRAG